MNYPKVSIIIVNYKQAQLTLDCLKSLTKINYPKYEIILVDNDSDPGQLNLITKKYPELKVIPNNENLGFAGGNNSGLPEVTGKYILLLNNDTKVNPDFLNFLVEDMENDPKLGIVQSKMFVMDNPTKLDNVVSYQTITGFLFHKGYLEEDKDEYKKFLYSFSAKGACILIRDEVLKLGLFDDDYFAYFEETDLCWRAWLLGFTVGFEPKSIVYHMMGATSSKMKRQFIHYHSFKNRIRTIIKDADSVTLAWMLPIHLLLCVALAGYFVFTEIEGTKSILRAFWWNILHSPDTLRQRIKVQKKRKVSDGQIFSQVMYNPSLFFYLNHLSLVRKNLSQS